MLLIETALHRTVTFTSWKSIDVAERIETACSKRSVLRYLGVAVVGLSMLTKTVITPGLRAHAKTAIFMQM
eukprot:10011647-Karenia_brevis.AAC.1